MADEKAMIETVPVEGPQLPEFVRFMGIEVETAPGVLVPREETELLGRSAVELLSEVPGEAIVVDMCCGSGNLALGIAAMVPTARIWASDLTDETVALARRNVQRCGLSGSARVVQGDLFSGLQDEGLEGRVDLIVCNPPYISTLRLEGDRSFLLENEPREAFDGGPYGLSIHQRLVREAAAFLKPGGHLAFEFGEGQDRQVKILLARAGIYEPVRFATNAAGTPRVAIARKRQEQ